MGNTVWVLKEGQEDDDWDHSFMLNEEDELNVLCKKHDVKPLSDLLDYSILNEEFGEGDDSPNFLNPSEIKPSLAILITLIKEGKSNLKQATEVLEELEDCLQKVTEAESEHSKIRLSIVP